MVFKTRITTAIATAAIIMGTVAPAAFASTTVVIGENGAVSNTSVNVSNNTGTGIVQNNVSNVTTLVGSSSTTGGNKANFNTNGNTGIGTGNATSKVTVNVGGSSNTANIKPTSNNNNTTVIVDHNGALSSNKVTVSNNSWFGAFQQNVSNIFTAISSNSGTGGNTSSFNTNGNTVIGTGDAMSKVTVNVGGSSNTLNK